MMDDGCGNTVGRWRFKVSMSEFDCRAWGYYLIDSRIDQQLTPFDMNSDDGL